MHAKFYTIIRYAIGLLFLWFGTQQLLDPGSWVGFLPTWTGYFPIPGEMLVQVNGWFEIVFSLLLLTGFFTRFVAFVLGIHLLCIALSVGGAIGMRDLALAVVTLALAIEKPSTCTLDAFFAKKLSSPKA